MAVFLYFLCFNVFELASLFVILISVSSEINANLHRSREHYSRKMRFPEEIETEFPFSKHNLTNDATGDSHDNVSFNYIIAYVVAEDRKCG